MLYVNKSRVQKSFQRIVLIRISGVVFYCHFVFLKWQARFSEMKEKLKISVFYKISEIQSSYGYLKRNTSKSTISLTKDTG